MLLSKKDNKRYIGYTKNLKLRFELHQKGQVKATRDRRPLKLIYYEAYLLKVDALRREKYLKSGGGRKELAKQLDSYFVKISYQYSR